MRETNGLPSRKSNEYVQGDNAGILDRRSLTSNHFASPMKEIPETENPDYISETVSNASKKRTS